MLIRLRYWQLTDDQKDQAQAWMEENCGCCDDIPYSFLARLVFLVDDDGHIEDIFTKDGERV